jgi:glutathione S-transferase
MKIVSFKICPFVHRVTALLAAKNIPYDLEFISLSDKPQWFLDVSPNGQVPVLITDEGVALFESDAIVEYIEEAYPVLQPDISLEQKAHNRAWSYLATKNYLVQCGSQRSADAGILAERRKKLDQAFDRVEKQLGDTPFFSGDEISTVDVSWLVLLQRAAIIEKHSGHDFIGNRPKLKAWQRALMGSGLAEKSVADGFEDDFTAFYLNDQTHLGQRAAQLAA